MALSMLELTICRGAEFVLGAERNLQVKVMVGFEDPDTGVDPTELEELGETEACLTISLTKTKHPLRLASWSQLVGPLNIPS